VKIECVLNDSKPPTASKRKDARADMEVEAYRGSTCGGVWGPDLPCTLKPEPQRLESNEGHVTTHDDLSR